MRFAICLALMSLRGARHGPIRNPTAPRRRDEDARVRRTPARDAAGTGADDGDAPVRRPRPRRLALHPAQPQRRGAEGARRARPRRGSRAAQDGALGLRLPQGRQHHRARARAARNRDVRPDARSRSATTSRSTARRAATSAWGWRFEGHHLSLNFTLAGDQVAVDTPSFFGANPATCRKDRAPASACWPRRRTKRERLLGSLSDAQRREAVFDADLRRHRDDERRTG